MRLSIIIALVLISCGKREIDLSYLEAYARDHRNGLIKEKQANGLSTSVRLVPPIIRELRQGVGCIEDRDRQLDVIVNISPDTAHYRGDVMLHGIRTMEQFRQRALLLNFNWEESVELRCGGSVYRPVLSSLENTYGLSKDRNIVLVFAPEHVGDTDFSGSKELEITIHDGTMGTGTQRFRFDRSALERVPLPTI